jgi:hypothetical protein
MIEQTRQKLVRRAQLAGMPERRVSPMQVAAQLQEDAVAQCPTE